MMVNFSLAFSYSPQRACDALRDTLTGNMFDFPSMRDEALPSDWGEDNEASGVTLDAAEVLCG